MIVKEVLSEELLTLSEVKGMLHEIMEERLNNEEELGYELRKAINHAEMFSKTTPEKARDLVNKLLELEKMKPEIAIRIADIMPQSRDELRSLYAKERFTLTEEELDEMLNLVEEAMD
ncbi:RNA polymerase Rpb4 family protein [Methanolobus sediminis]|uniref:DNA-directed RNA polymerase subunit Rpo4 n=1 Tax=Methanolobus sediminis TaxID=3072978 RepID=A0AA51UK76_9EURY|nr:RNA polymerase Rpb4 family protein [Methanolobus sediminis]WMW24618.1 RNA polymerase Rpb4 family protein [Methanolobus sediminis]